MVRGDGRVFEPISELISCQDTMHPCVYGMHSHPSQCESQRRITEAKSLVGHCGWFWQPCSNFSQCRQDEKHSEADQRIRYHDSSRLSPESISASFFEGEVTHSAPESRVSMCNRENTGFEHTWPGFSHCRPSILCQWLCQYLPIRSAGLSCGTNGLRTN